MKRWMDYVMARIWLYLQVTIWSCLVFFLLILYNPQRVVELISSRKSKSGWSAEKIQIIKYVRSVCRRNPLAKRRPCLHRSLLLYKFLQSTGCSPTLNIGFVIKSFLQQEEKSIGDVHAWITVDDQVVLDDRINSKNLYPHFLWTLSNIRYWTSLEVVQSDDINQQVSSVTG